MVSEDPFEIHGPTVAPQGVTPFPPDLPTSTRGEKGVEPGPTSRLTINDVGKGPGPPPAASDGPR